jgi:hypothetical protein
MELCQLSKYFLFSLKSKWFLNSQALLQCLPKNDI